MQGSGSNWLFPLVDGHPPIGWHDALCYLVLPVVLVISQVIVKRGGGGSLQSVLEDPHMHSVYAARSMLACTSLGILVLNVDLCACPFVSTVCLSEDYAATAADHGPSAAADTGHSEVPPAYDW